MTDFRVGYLYSLSPIHCGGEGDLGNILDIAREVHTHFPYIPGSSLRGSLREEVRQLGCKTVCDRLFGQELGDGETMGVHQVWFGDSRLLWVPMRTMTRQGKDIFTWVSCHSLLRDHALISRQPSVMFPDQAVGDRAGSYTIADAQIQVGALSEAQKKALDLAGQWHENLQGSVQTTWHKSRIILPDADFQVLMEHSLWTQIRNKIQEDAGGAEVFWTDVCIPRDTIFYYAWGYNLLKENAVTGADHAVLLDLLQGLLQVGGQANIGRGWLQSWIAQTEAPRNIEKLSTAAEA